MHLYEALSRVWHSETPHENTYFSPPLLHPHTQTAADYESRNPSDNQSVATRIFLEKDADTGIAG